MALTKQVLAISLREGLDTKSDPKQVVPGRLLIMENGILTKLGSVQKRNGYAAISNAVAAGAISTALGGVLPTTRLLSPFKTQLFLAGTGLGFNYASSQAKWVPRGAAEALQISVMPVFRNVYQQTSPDSAVHPTGVQVVAWEDSSGGTRYIVIDTLTGQTVVASTRLGTTATKPKCLVLGNFLIVVYYETSTNSIDYVAIPVLTPNLPAAPASIATDPSTNQTFDATIVGGTRLFLAYANNSAGATQLSVRYMISTFGVSSAFLVTGSTVLPTVVSVWANANNNVNIAWFASPNLLATAVDFNLATLLFSAVTIDSAATGTRNIIGTNAGSLFTDLAGVSVGQLSTIVYEVGASPAYNTVLKTGQVNAFPVPPVLHQPFVSLTGGTLAAGTYYYVVTAIGTTGATLASNEQTIVTTGTTSSVALTWDAIVGAVSYRIYRGTSYRGENTMYSSTVPSFADTGAAGTASTPPMSNTFVGVVTQSTLIRSVGLASKPWYVNGAIHFLTGYSSALQSTYFILALSAAGTVVVGQLAPGVAGGVTTKVSNLPEVMQTATGVFSVPYLLNHEIGAQAGVVLSQTGVSVAALDYAAPQMAVELSDNLHVTGGMLYSFDGASVVEHNFLLYPENVIATPSGTGGAMLAGQYQYVVVFEWWDAFGLHQSGTSVPVTVTTSGSTSSVALTIPALRLTNRTTPISIAVYRTAANGTVFYRLGNPASPLLNSTIVNSVNFTDTVADSSIIGSAQLYTTGGEVDNQVAPAPSVVCTYNNRMMLVPSEAPLTIWYSKQVVQGVPVEFSPTFQMTVDQRGGPITAMTQMDDKLIIFKQAQIFALVGDGPAANGTPVPAYPQPDRITADSGCISAKSLVLIPTGLMYQSGKGIYLLGRDLQTTYIGAAVEAYNSARVTSATQVPNTTQVRFTLDSGVCLVYDWLVDQWGTFTNIAAADAAVFNGLFTYCRTTGVPLTETPGTFTDAGNPIKLRLQTSWLSFAGMQGVQRVWEALVLGEYRSAHSLRVSLAFDYDPTPHEVVDVDASALLGHPVYGGASPYGTGTYGGTFPLYQFRIKLIQERCQAVQVTVEDNQVAPPYGEGMALSVISFVAGTLGTGKKIPSTRTFGA